MLYKIVIDSMFIVHTPSSEEWVSYRLSIIYIHILYNLSVLNDFLFSWLEFWESTFTLGHKDLFYWSISLVWGIA